MTTLTFDDALTTHVGGLGRGQVGVVLTASLSHIPMAMALMLMVFTSQDPIVRGDWQCRNTSSVDDACATVRAQSPIRRNDFCGLDRSAWEWRYKGYSLLSDYGLVCGREWSVDVLNSSFFVGLAIGGTIFGALADKYGRKRLLLACMALAAVCTALEALSPYFWLHALFGIAGAAALQGVALADVVLVTELVAADHRGSMGILTQSFFIIGECLLALLAWLIPGWRPLSLACAVACAAFLATAPALMESPRWLLSQGRVDEAVQGLVRLGRRNGRQVEPWQLSGLGLAAGGSVSHHAAAAGDGDSDDAERDGSGCVGRPAPRKAPAQTASALPGPCYGDTGANGGGGGAGVAVQAHQGGYAAALQRGTSSKSQDQMAAHMGQGSATGSSGLHGDGAALTCALRHDDALAGGEEPPPPPLHGASQTAHRRGQQAPPVGAAVQGAAPLVPPATVSLRGALRHRLVITYFFILTYALCANVLTYYGVGFALQGVHGNIYLNFFLVSIAEAPASAFVGLAIDRAGRTALVIGGMVVSGAACIAAGYSLSTPWLQVLFSMLGKFGCSGAWSVLVVYTAEVYPTAVRSVLSGMIYQGARVGGIVSPFIFSLGRQAGADALPYWLMGAASLLGAALSLRLPETAGVPQPDTLVEMERGAGRTAFVIVRGTLARCCGGRRRRGSERHCAGAEPCGRSGGTSHACRQEGGCDREGGGSSNGPKQPYAVPGGGWQGQDRDCCEQEPLVQGKEPSAYARSTC